MILRDLAAVQFEAPREASGPRATAALGHCGPWAATGARAAGPRYDPAP